MAALWRHVQATNGRNINDAVRCIDELYAAESYVINESGGWVRMNRSTLIGRFQHLHSVQAMISDVVICTLTAERLEFHSENTRKSKAARRMMCSLSFTPQGRILSESWVKFSPTAAGGGGGGGGGGGAHDDSSDDDCVIQ